MCFVQSWFYVQQLSERSPKRSIRRGCRADGYLTFGWQLVAVLTMTCGTIFLMWLGEQIDEYGIGNGISLLIMAGIVARMPGAGRAILHDSDAASWAARPASSALKTC